MDQNDNRASAIELACQYIDSIDFEENDGKDPEVNPNSYAAYNWETMNKIIPEALFELKTAVSNTIDTAATMMGILYSGRTAEEIQEKTDPEEWRALTFGFLSAGMGDNAAAEGTSTPAFSLLEKIDNVWDSIRHVEVKDNDPKIFEKEVTPLLKDLAADARAYGDNIAVTPEKIPGIIAECNQILAERMDNAPDSEKTRIAEAGLGMFRYGTDADGNVDKNVIIADPGYSIKDNGAFADRFGLSLSGQPVYKVEDTSEGKMGRPIEMLCHILNLDHQDTPEKILDDRVMSDVVKGANAFAIMSTGEYQQYISTPEYGQVQDSLDKFGQAMQELYGVDIPTQDKVEAFAEAFTKDYDNAVLGEGNESKADIGEDGNPTDKGHDEVSGMDASGDHAAGQDTSNPDTDGKESGFQPGFHAAKDAPPIHDTDGPFVDESTTSGVEGTSRDNDVRGYSAGAMKPWAKTGNPQIDNVIDMRNGWLAKNPRYSNTFIFKYAEYHIIDQERKLGIVDKELGRVPTFLDSCVAFGTMGYYTNPFDRFVVKLTALKYKVAMGLEYERRPNVEQQPIKSVEQQPAKALEKDPDVWREEFRNKVGAAAIEMDAARHYRARNDLADSVRTTLEMPSNSGRQMNGVFAKDREGNVQAGRLSGEFFGCVKTIIEVYGKEAAPLVIRDVFKGAIRDLIDQTPSSQIQDKAINFSLDLENIRTKGSDEKGIIEVGGVSINLKDLIGELNEDLKKDPVTAEEKPISKEESEIKPEDEAKAVKEEEPDSKADEEKERNGLEKTSPTEKMETGSEENEKTEKVENKGDRATNNEKDSSDNGPDGADNKTDGDNEIERDDLEKPPSKEEQVEDNPKAEQKDGKATASESDKESPGNITNDEKNGKGSSDNGGDIAKKLNLTKEQAALMNVIKKLPSGISAGNITNNQEIRGLVADIRKTCDGKNISNPIAKVMAAVSLSTPDREDKESWIKTVDKGLQGINKVDGLPLKIENLIKNAGNIVKDYMDNSQKMGIVTPETRIAMELGEKCKDYIESKIPLSDIRMEVKGFMDNAGGQVKDFVTGVASALSDTVEAYSEKIVSGAQSVRDKIGNIFDAVAKVTGTVWGKINDLEQRIDRPDNIDRLIREVKSVGASAVVAGAVAFGTGADVSADQADRAVEQAITGNVRVEPTEKEETLKDPSSQADGQENGQGNADVDRMGEPDNVGVDTENSDDPDGRISGEPSGEEKFTDTDGEDVDKTAPDRDGLDDIDPAGTEDPGAMDNEDVGQEEDVDSPDQVEQIPDMEEPDAGADTPGNEDPDDVDRGDTPDTADNTDDDKEPAVQEGPDGTEFPDGTDMEIQDIPEETGQADPDPLEQNPDTEIEPSEENDIDPDAEDSPDHPEDDANEAVADDPSSEDFEEKEWKNGEDVAAVAELPVPDVAEDEIEPQDGTDQDGAGTDDNDDLEKQEDDSADPHGDTDEEEDDRIEREDEEADGTDPVTFPDEMLQENGPAASDDTYEGAAAGQDMGQDAIQTPEGDSDVQAFVADAISSYVSDGMFDFDDFLNSPAGESGATLAEAFANGDISPEEAAQSVAEAIAGDSDNIIEDEELTSDYADLISDLSDLFGDSFTDSLCDYMDPFSTVNDVVDEAFNNIADDMLYSSVENMQTDPGADGIDISYGSLADLEFTVMDYIDDNNLIDTGVESALTGVDNVDMEDPSKDLEMSAEDMAVRTDNGDSLFTGVDDPLVDPVDTSGYTDTTQDQGYDDSYMDAVQEQLDNTQAPDTDYMQDSFDLDDDLWRSVG